MDSRCFSVGAALAAAVLCGCAPTSGVGTASTPTGNVAATISWQSTGGRTGTMTAALGNGETYSGPFFQITRETQVDTLGPLWNGWYGPWPGWNYWGGYWGPGPSTAFVTNYTGKVLANLQGPMNTHMRCRFHLIRPTTGMGGGGAGQCQLPDEQTIDATFPPG